MNWIHTALGAAIASVVIAANAALMIVGVARWIDSSDRSCPKPSGPPGPRPMVKPFQSFGFHFNPNEIVTDGYDEPFYIAPDFSPPLPVSLGPDDMPVMKASS